MSRIFAPGRFSSSPRTFVFFLLLLQVYAEKRPFWNIAHNVISIPEIVSALEQGANSISFGVTYSNDGIPQRIGQSDSPDCNCNRRCRASEDIATYLDYLRQLTDPTDPKFRKELTLIVVDNKLENVNDPRSKIFAGERLSTIFDTYYWKGGRSDWFHRLITGEHGLSPTLHPEPTGQSGRGKANILFVVPSTTYINFFHGLQMSPLLPSLVRTFGYEVASRDESFNTIRSMYNLLKIPSEHVWQSAGVSNCLNKSGQCICSEIDKGFARLQQAVNIRNTTDSYMVKVRAWTPDENDAFRKALSLDVDAVMTDYPQRLNAVLQEPEFASKFLLAGLSHTPWRKYKGDDGR